MGMVDVGSEIHAIGVSHDGARIAVGVLGYILSIDPARRSVIQRWSLGSAGRSPWRIAIVGAHLLVEAGHDGASNADETATDLFVARCASAADTMTLITPDTGEDSASAWAAGERLAVGTTSGEIELHAMDGRVEASAAVFDEPVTALAWSPDRRSLAAASWSGELAVLEPTALRDVARWEGLPHGAYGEVAISDDRVVIRTIEPSARGRQGAVVARPGRPGVRFVPLPPRRRFTTLQIDPVSSTAIWCRVLALGGPTERRFGSVLQHDLDGDARPIARLAIAGESPSAVTVSGDGRWIAGAFGTRVRYGALRLATRRD